MSSPFKIIVVGAGPAGLVAAHALHHANIDFVLLERRNSIYEDVGASLVLEPQSIRVMSQLGLWDKLQKFGTEMMRLQVFTRDGHQFKNSSAIRTVNECHGSAPVAFHRADLLRVMYDALPSDSKPNILYNKHVDNIMQDEKGVTVNCRDGTSFHGAVVIGADGVHSQTRREMRRAVLQGNPGADWDDEYPFKATYRCLWSNFPLPSGVEPGIGGETNHQHRSIMTVYGKDRGWIFLYEKLPVPTKHRVTYTPEDIDAFAASFIDWPITNKLKVRDVFNRKTAGMANLEEGMLKHFSAGRVVLVGDACHKFTPNAGLGFNMGVQDVTALCNGIHAAVARDPARCPDLGVLKQVFEEYQNARSAIIARCLQLSSIVTRLQAWANTIYFVASRYILCWPFLEISFLRYVASRRIGGSLVLDYITGEEPLHGFVGWTHPIKPHPKEEA
ncbi:FAD binding domain-containing protein [Stachybotrys elegans]|uniref:FAD binding domain-containing protein n=1 Tax=Stachybotrys elegans TaxID=80388 RepID=A0A8K0WQ64_9HYPO|nr:FAD binding domain-containing protein [Stachybotrys elegans]